MAWAPEASRQAAPVKLAVGSVLHSGGARRLFDHALTEWGQADGDRACGRAS